MPVRKLTAEWRVCAHGDWGMLSGMKQSQGRLLVMLLGLPLFAQDGAALYKQHCARCHDGGVARAPQAAALQLMSPENVQFALISGAMQTQGGTLTRAEIRSVSEFVTGKTTSAQAFEKSAYCSAPGPALDNALAQPH